MSKGLFVWFDLMTPDVAAARAFYGGVFDWSIQPHGPTYAMIHVADRPCGGIAARPGGPALWVPY
ncbi:MAG: VOC family protein, partial [Myxococcota bacterium]